MLVRDIGEFALIDALESSIHDRNALQIEHLRALGVEVQIGIGDDAAAWKYPESTVVSTTDTMVEGVHFKTETTGWSDLGWKAMASNLSDVGSMGCSPTFALVTLGLRGDLPVEGLCQMYSGMVDVCEATGGALIGGDVVRSDTFFVTVALEGIGVTDRPVLTRSVARIGDLVAVTGHLGCSAAGLQLLLEPEAKPDIAGETRNHLLAAHNRPMPRVAEGQGLKGLGVRCAMDVSDGLVADLTKVCVASGVSSTIKLDNIPADTHLRSAFPESWPQMALGGGEDYELVFTADEATMKTVVERFGDFIAVIGTVVEGSGEVTVVDSNGARIDPDSAGWDHFAN